ncbi:hypothetical protein [Tautonia plasticadhaerens]|uniref:Uncharacterized protein n=1 Tax=Tautonia plasticadhaerens TaxID=2527974 RepID=A0A518GV14_9BACT|nr:hypothetical protein [Tautonia plasticadhaerens]QDV32431.1 hypothetical protein ElP_02630 [Tautonia plasticadhaerens]
MTGLTPRRLRAPASDGALLAEPPMAEAPGLLDANRRRLSSWDHDFQGRRAGRLRSMARSEILDRSRRFLLRFGLDDLDGLPDPSRDADAPLVVTGHQPELSHPGVWVKNFAAASIARAVGGLGLNLIVDNDIPKAVAVRVPFRDGDRLKARHVPFDEWAGESPFEDLRVQDEQTFASFADRALGLMGGLVPDPLLPEDWPRAVLAAGQTDRLGLRLAAMRRAREASWGARNAEVPLGGVCESEAFLWFASHLLAHLPRFREVHNESLDRYRKAHGIRSKNHPVPALATEGDWQEAPFWAWRRDHPRRRPLMARQVDPSRMQLRIAGDDEPLVELTLGPDRDACCAVERLRELPGRGVRLRTRALTTTMFARALLGDLFIHGIGGAKYDELGDEIFRGFFGVDPPGYLTLSLTLWPGLPDDPASAGQLREVGARIRDLTFNPDRHLPDPLPEAAREALEAKRAALAGPVGSRAQRAARYFAIRRANAELSPFVSADREGLRRREGRLRAGLARNALAHSREYAAVLHPADRLRSALLGAAGGPRI